MTIAATVAEAESSDEESEDKQISKKRKGERE
jgi:hypothetical protein